MPQGLTYEEFLRCRGLPCEDFQKKQAAISQINNLLKDTNYEERSTVRFNYTSEVLDGCVRLNARQTQNLVIHLRELQENQQTRRKRHTINFDKYGNRKWRVTRIQYKIEEDYTQEYITKLEQSLRHIEDKTCFTFERVANDGIVNDDHIIFSNEEKACWAYIGRVAAGSYPQLINLHERCIDFFGIPVHEVIHSLGFWHQHQRPDRENYIKLNCDLINGGCEHDQMKIPNDVKEPSIPYDYNSVMHYSGFSNARDRSRLHELTIKALDKGHQKAFGQRVEMSFLDAKLIHNEYCQAKCNSNPPNCQNGGFPNSKNCAKCICADGFGGSLCQDVAPSTTGCFNRGDIVLGIGEERVINTPNYGTGYKSGDKCNWRISAPPGYQVKITFDSNFRIYCYKARDDSGLYIRACLYHWVEVKYDYDLSKNGYRLCCESQPKPITSKGRIMVVAFRSLEERRGHYVGFRARLSTVRADGQPVEPTKEPTIAPTTKTTTTTTLPTTTKLPSTTPDNGVRWSEWSDCSFRSCQCGGCDFQFRFHICRNQYDQYEACYGERFGLEMKKCNDEERMCGSSDKYPIFIGKLYYQQCSRCCVEFKEVAGRCVKRQNVNSLTQINNRTDIPEEAKFNVDKAILEYNKKGIKVTPNNAKTLNFHSFSLISSIGFVLLSFLLISN
ncbi:DgyrCDS11736 [Dimorphilus gyrociliatus]|uniref:Metalloendopeptidase n=1 Tax=Dimorphilus gyrociliatus TaxID=2664684 RepID=A0A7I8W652_9ANNE|nr:DgyrCDS11736 [Dimorphilus gyrociliatus]